jgi:hypothetical protein
MNGIDQRKEEVLKMTRYAIPEIADGVYWVGVKDWDRRCQVCQNAPGSIFMTMPMFLFY